MLKDNLQPKSEVQALLDAQAQGEDLPSLYGIPMNQQFEQLSAAHGPEGITVGEWLQEWLSDESLSCLRPATFELYAHTVNARLVPDLGHFTLAALRPQDLNSYFRWALTHGRRNGKGGLSTATVQRCYSVLCRSRRGRGASATESRSGSTPKVLHAKTGSDSDSR
ncbi:MAG: N-terminal phage integrase SAM-like domain-containing protein [Chloroflexi bacterium]|nr:N-terminal phage integrase SAM-like domain-containing protein [Chloroflexota bacterium]